MKLGTAPPIVPEPPPDTVDDHPAPRECLACGVRRAVEGAADPNGSEARARFRDGARVRRSGMCDRARERRRSGRSGSRSPTSGPPAPAYAPALLRPWIARDREPNIAPSQHVDPTALSPAPDPFTALVEQVATLTARVEALEESQ